MDAILLIFMMSTLGELDTMIMQFPSMVQCESARALVIDALIGAGAKRVAKVAAACTPLVTVKPT